eukprot:TRINITY_DN2770_c2_g1_i1.p2 TRINITY_DN2770_c2_g1~~TRINITY_DN2770_c2_g1_i1.p2  ORF type:complete len:258 (+),score=46.58 TRINITY_DN2770_c2_g1_i1:1985-2758(+)
MKEAVADMRNKIKEAERKHRITHMSQIIDTVEENLNKIELSDERTAHCTSGRRRKKEKLFQALGLLDGRHVNTVTDSIHHILMRILHTSGWFSIRLKTLMSAVRKIQRLVRCWLIVVTQKKALLLHVWSSTEAHGQSNSSRRSLKKRYQPSQGFETIKELTNSYFRKWVPKDLKLEVISDLYRESKMRWRQRYMDWRSQTRHQRCGVKERKEMLKEMYHCENTVRFMCGLPPSVREDGELDAHISSPPGMCLFATVC